MWQVLDEIAAMYEIKNETVSLITSSLHELVARDNHFSKTGELQDYDGNLEQDIIDRIGFSYEVATVIVESCFEDISLDDDKRETVISGLVRDFEYNYRKGARAYSGFHVS
jgi:hypothetical protein